MTRVQFSKEKQRLVLALLLCVGIQIASAWNSRREIALGYPDFAGFYAAGEIVDTGQGARLYDLGLQAQIEGQATIRKITGGFLPFVHPPFFALLMAPLARLGYLGAFWVWWTINVLLTLAAMALLARVCPQLRKRADLLPLGFALFFPLLAAEYQGQDSILSLLLYVCCFLALERGRPALSGAALALTCYKPQLALGMLALLLISQSRRWRILAGFASTCAVLVLISAGTAGWRVCFNYPHFLTWFSSHLNEADYHVETMHSLRGLLFATMRHLPEAAHGRILAMASAVVAAGTVWAMLRARQAASAQLRFALAVLSVLLTAYYCYTHDLTLLLIPCALTRSALAETGLNSRRLKLLDGLTLGLVAGSFLANTVPAIYTGAMIVFWGLLVAEVRAGAPKSKAAFS